MAILIPLAVTGAALGLVLLALGNVRERRIEIGLFRSLGLRSSQIYGLFLGRAALLGLVGAVTGWLAGGLVAWCWGDVSDLTDGAEWLLDPWIWAGPLAAAPLLAALASWAPACLAVRQDPAVVLREA